MNVYVVPFGSSPQPQLIQALSKGGMSARMETMDKVPSFDGSNRAIIVLCGDVSEAEIKKRLSDLGSNSQLGGHGAILVGRSSCALNTNLNTLFDVSATLKDPKNYQEIVSTAADMANYLSGFEQPDNSKNSKEVKLDDDDTNYSETEIVELDVDVSRDSILDMMSSLPSTDAPLGGARYPSFFDPKSVDMRFLLPQDLELSQKIQSHLEDLGKWNEAHIKRVAFITQSALFTVDISIGYKDAAKVAALLYGWAFEGNDLKLLKKMYTTEKSNPIKLALCSRLKDSAMKILMEISHGDAGAIVASLAKLICEEEGLKNKPESLIASTIGVADLIDRSTFQSGRWNPRAGAKLLRKLQQGEIRFLHPVVAPGIIKFLTEALNSKLSNFLLLPRKIKDQKQFFQKIQEMEDTESGFDDLKIPVSQLVPGMRLSQHLVTYEGRVVLEQFSILDGDLILRLWQLSSVCPIITPRVLKDSIGA